MTGRFAPSPTGDLHVGNLRTAAIAWLSARSAGDRFLIRMEDLDRVQSSAHHEDGQLRDLAAIGLHQHFAFQLGAREHGAAKPEASIFLAACERLTGEPPARGRFGADMEVELINDGPVTLCLDTWNKE